MPAWLVITTTGTFQAFAFAMVSATPGITTTSSARCRRCTSTLMTPSRSRKSARLAPIGREHLALDPLAEQVAGDDVRLLDARSALGGDGDEHVGELGEHAAALAGERDHLDSELGFELRGCDDVLRGAARGDGD